MVAIVSLGATRTFALRPRGGGPVAAASAPPRRPAGDGRVMPTHLGARDPEDNPAHRTTDQHPVPPARRALTLDGGDGCGQQVSGALGVDRRHRLARHHQRVGGDDHLVVAETARGSCRSRRSADVPLIVVCSTRCTPWVSTSAICGAGTTSTVPRTAPPAKDTFLQLSPGSVTGIGSEVSNAMVMNRLPSPSAETRGHVALDARPGTAVRRRTSRSRPGRTSIPRAVSAPASTLGSMPVIGTSVTVNSGPNDDFTSATFAMLAVC